MLLAELEERLARFRSALDNWNADAKHPDRQQGDCSASEELHMLERTLGLSQYDQSKRSESQEDPFAPLR